MLFAVTGCSLLGVLIYSCSTPEISVPAPTPPPAPTDETLRVLLSTATGPAPISLLIEGEARLHADGKEERLSPVGPLKITPGAKGVAVGDRPPASAIRMKGPPGTVFELQGRQYWGEIVIRAKRRGMEVINEVPLETYLLGVIGGEMPPSWEIEALKAQAVAARTYSISRKRAATVKGSDFDLFDDTRSQVYIGLPPARYAARIEQAVQGTAGEVLLYEGRLLTAYFHSTCGGHTEGAVRVFHTDGIPPLEGVPCTFCKDSTSFRWELKIPKADAAAKLGVKELQAIRGLDPGRSGRFRKVAVQGEGGEVVLSANQFRELLGFIKVKSSAFEAEISEDTLQLKGRGFGHGVGMCQWGARGMAKAGKRYHDILAHYYPGALLLQIAVLSPDR
jgi:stage II sporulation protein D